MSELEAVVLGIVQGLTEFLPISSTAHLRIVPAFVGWEDPGAAFTAVVQLGTVAAVLLYFRAELIKIATAWLRSIREPALRSGMDARLGWYIVLGTIPVGIFGFAFRDQIETGARSLYVIGIAMIALALVLLLAEEIASHDRDLRTLNRGDATVIGLAQALALVPGVSRSGATITAGLFRGLDRPSAARYSFLISVPAVVLSGLFEARHVTGGTDVSVTATLIATVLAFVVGYASIAFLLRFLTHHTTRIFVAYRIVVGAAVLALAGSGVIS